MKEIKYVITDPVGIHARPAGLLVNLAKAAASSITVSKGDKSAEMKKLMKLMSLGVKTGNVITVAAEGPAEDEAIEAMKKFFEENL